MPDQGDSEGRVDLNITALVRNEKSVNGIDFRSIVNMVQKATGKRPSIVSEADYSGDGNVIVIGDTELECTKAAIGEMDKYVSKNELGQFDIPYSICCKDGDIAVVWEHSLVSDYAIQRMLELISDGAIEAGFVETGHKAIGWDLVESEEKAREEKMNGVRKILGDEAADALSDHLALATDEFYIWLANLYEPRTCICDNYDELGYRVCLLPKDENGNYLCYGGGFYYSNSARDTEGYYIDIESTKQVIMFLVSGGLMSNYRGIDQQIKNDMVAFAQSLQSSEDGYFYHPQWGTNISVSRRGRDLGSSTNIISEFGGKPLYDAPNGAKGTLGKPGQSSALYSPLTDSSAVIAVSKVIAAASWPAQLESLSAFEEYLDSFDLKNSSYSAGNTIASQTAQIVQRDKEGLKSGEFHDADGNGKADDGLIAAFERHFNEAQNPENGLWQDSVHYSSVNGLMKLSAAYNSLGVKISNAIAAFESAVFVALIDADSADSKGKRATGSVDVFNPWVAMSNIISNMKKHGDYLIAEELQKILKANAAAMIRVTTAKVKKFAKSDGSYGYTWNSSPSKSQGAPVCPEGIIEGDVNGGLIAISGSLREMLAAIGVSIKPYSESDGLRFIYIIENISPTKTKYDL